MTRTQNDIAAEAANHRFTCAVWYAYGQIDAGRRPATVAGGAFEFAGEQAERARTYSLGGLTSLPSIMTEWEAFLERHGAPVPAPMEAMTRGMNRA